MSRKSVLLGLGLALLLVSAVGGLLLLLVLHEPEYYSQTAQPPGPERKANSTLFWKECSDLVSAISNDRKWGAEFTQDEINSFFEEDFGRLGADETPLPDGITQPRVTIEQEKVRLGFRYGSGTWSTVVSVDFRVWLAVKEPNAVALELQGFHAGSLPISAQSLLERVSDIVRRRNVEVRWFRYGNNPVALLRFQSDQPHPSVKLTGLDLRPGKIVVRGESLDSVPTALLLPATAQRTSLGN
jgi:hypothetical protein